MMLSGKASEPFSRFTRVMSYIHDALKRAQEEKDSRYGGYENIIKIPEKSSRRRYRVIITTVCLLLAVLVSAGILRDGGYRTDQSGQPQVYISPAGDGKTAEEQAVDTKAWAKALYGEALTHHGRGDLKKAELLYRKILDAEPSFSYAANNLGVIYLFRGDREDARMLFNDASAGADDYADPWYNLACLYAGVGDEHRAIDCLEKALSIDSKVKSWAEHDTDLAGLRSSPRFIELMGRTEAFEATIESKEP